MLQETKTTICNKALSLCGEDPINSVQDDTNLQARSCRAHFDLALHKVLEEGHWPFVTVEEPLQKILAKEYSEEQKYLYSIPNNCAIITRVYKKYDRKNMMENADWDLRFIESLYKTVIVCDKNNVSDTEEADPNEEVICEYVRAVDNFASYPASFIETLSACLAYMICMDITKDTQKFTLLLQLYEKLRDSSLRRAYNEDGEDKMHWVDPITNSRG